MRSLSFCESPPGRFAWRYLLAGTSLTLLCTGLACGPPRTSSEAASNSDPVTPAIVDAAFSPSADTSGFSLPDQANAAEDDPNDKPSDQAPGSLRVISPRRGLITVTWEDRSFNETSFVVMRSTDATTWRTCAQLPANTTSYSDAAVRDGIRYYYKVGRVTRDNTKFSGIDGATAAWNSACLVRCPSTRPGRAFPSAEGFGALSKGGRGGATVFVTSLADYDSTAGESAIPGTLRWAVEAVSGPRTVVFRVGGTIEAKNDIEPRDEKGSFLTIAGQSAPGEGIQLKGHGILVYNAHDIVIRYLRIRPGYTSDTDWDKDAVTIWGSSGGVSRDVIVDHCSLEWAIDENGNVWDAAENLTFQYCIFGEGSLFGHHGHDGEPDVQPGYAHSCGFLAGGPGSFPSDTYLSLHHNLFIQNMNRNPALGQFGGLAEFVNNIVYNWGSYAGSIWQDEAGSISPRVNLIGNFFQSGPAYFIGYQRRAVDLKNLENSVLYVRDNLGPFRPDASIDDWAITGEESLFPSAYFEGDVRQRRYAPWPAGGVHVTTDSASSLMASLPNRVGCTFPAYDSVDKGLILNLLNGTGELGFGTSPETAAAFPVIANGPSPADSDSDGMPDGWELSQGLDPKSASDAQQDPDGDGYTNLEEYLNDIVQEK